MTVVGSGAALATDPTLYPAQQDAVTALCRQACFNKDNPGKVRHMLAAHTGCGKTAMAIAAAQALKARRILVICPAIVRRHWASEFIKWARRVDVGVIEMGRERKVSKRADLIRCWGYQSNVQIVSYDLVKHIAPLDWDMVIIDEVHNLGYPMSKQSSLVRSLVKANSKAHVLCLSATLMPRSPLQVWHPLHLLGVRNIGKLSKTNDIPWDFKLRYFEKVETEHGLSVGPLREDRKEELEALVASHAIVVRREDIAPNLPKLRVSPLYVAKRNKQMYADWIGALPADVTHVVILPYHHSEALEATEVACQRPRTDVFHINGDMPPGARTERLEIAAQPRSNLTVLVATQESVSEGIRFMWAQKALITEPQAIPGKLTQLLGRFQSVGSDAAPQVEVCIEDGKESVCDVVMERASDINAVLSGTIADGVTSTFASRDVSPERAEASLASMFGDATLYNSAEWSNDYD